MSSNNKLTNSTFQAYNNSYITAEANNSINNISTQQGKSVFGNHMTPKANYLENKTTSSIVNSFPQFYNKKREEAFIPHNQKASKKDSNKFNLENIKDTNSSLSMSSIIEYINNNIPYHEDSDAELNETSTKVLDSKDAIKTYFNEQDKNAHKVQQMYINNNINNTMLISDSNSKTNINLNIQEKSNINYNTNTLNTVNNINTHTNPINTYNMNPYNINFNVQDKGVLLQHFNYLNTISDKESKTNIPSQAKNTINNNYNSVNTHTNNTNNNTNNIGYNNPCYDEQSYKRFNSNTNNNFCNNIRNIPIPQVPIYNNNNNLNINTSNFNAHIAYQRMNYNPQFNNNVNINHSVLPNYSNTHNHNNFNINQQQYINNNTNNNIISNNQFNPLFYTNSQNNIINSNNNTRNNNNINNLMNNNYYNTPNYNIAQNTNMCLIPKSITPINNIINNNNINNVNGVNEINNANNMLIPNQNIRSMSGNFILNNNSNNNNIITSTTNKINNSDISNISNMSKVIPQTNKEIVSYENSRNIIDVERLNPYYFQSTDNNSFRNSIPLSNDSNYNSKVNSKDNSKTNSVRFSKLSSDKLCSKANSKPSLFQKYSSSIVNNYDTNDTKITNTSQRTRKKFSSKSQFSSFINNKNNTSNLECKEVESDDSSMINLNEEISKIKLQLKNRKKNVNSNNANNANSSNNSNKNKAIILDIDLCSTEVSLTLYKKSEINKCIIAKYKEDKKILTRINSNYLVNFCCTKKGSKLVQDELESKQFSEEEVNNMLSKLLPSIDELIYNQFGNFLVQNLINALNDKQIKVFFEYIKKNIFDYCNHTNGNHTIQILILNIKRTTTKKALIDCLNPNFPELSASKFGVYVLQRLMETYSPEIYWDLTTYLVDNSHVLIKDENGLLLCKKFIYLFNPNENNMLNIIDNKKKHNDDNTNNDILIENTRQNFLNNIKKELTSIIKSKVGQNAFTFLIKSWGLEFCHSIINEIEKKTQFIVGFNNSSNVLSRILTLSNEKNKRKFSVNSLNYIKDYSSLINNSNFLSILKVYLSYFTQTDLKAYYSKIQNCKVSKDLTKSQSSLGIESVLNKNMLLNVIENFFNNSLNVDSNSD